jgi:hypothetical protein
MRLALSLIVLGSLILAQKPTTVRDCGIQNTTAWQNYEEYEYQKSLLRLLRPEDRSLVSLSVFETGNLPKLFIRIKAPGVFEELRASSAENLRDSLTQLGANCQLPISPREAIKLIDIKWERKSISPDQFQHVYTSFSNALLQYTSNVKKRPTKNGDRITVDSPEFSVLYDTAGFESFEITAVMSRDEAGSLDDPIAKWAQSFIEEVGETFDRASNQDQVSRGR